MTNWLPIRDAPKDGTRVIVWSYSRVKQPYDRERGHYEPHVPDFVQDGEVCVAWYCDLTTNMPDENGFVGWIDVGGSDIAPTHWIKMLEAPYRLDEINLEDKELMSGYNESDHKVPENERGRVWFAGDGIDCRTAA